MCYYRITSGRLEIASMLVLEGLRAGSPVFNLKIYFYMLRTAMGRIRKGKENGK